MYSLNLALQLIKSSIKYRKKTLEIKSIFGERGYKKLYKLKKYRTVRGCESRIHGNSIKSA